MGLFDFNKQKNKSQSTTEQSNQASNFGLNATQLFGPQAQALSQLYPQATALANQQQGQIGQQAHGLAGQLGGQGQQFLGQLGGQNQGTQGLLNFAGGGLTNFAGNNPMLASGFNQLNQLAQGGTDLQQQLQTSQANPYIDQAINNLGDDVTQQLARQNQAIGQDFTLSGTRGGSRHGVQQGIAQEGALDAFTQQAGNIRAQDASQQRQLQQSGQLAALQSQLSGAQGLTGEALNQQLGAGSLGLQQGGQQLGALQSAGNQINQGAGIGLGSLGGMFNLGLGGFGAEFSPLQSLAGLSPAILQSFGFNQGQSSGQSSSQMTSSGSSMGFGVGDSGAALGGMALGIL